ncbi:helix-turn-helix domain-containing protein [Streptosporangium carneum]|uniref:Transcriptional regulator n=1 Tax=Streptosporangium carneum TaxID=47481 RepID=A0A9W6MG37_9ACTN|nr:helix-turn-helix transcriptional regulator [Streptosporangium carneum]GLK12896.1 transcriptional regulator [Streptosporangium carneum]
MPALRELDPKAGRKQEFGVELRRLRLAEGLTQAELGRRIGYSTSLVGSVEIGKRAPVEQFITRCEEIFGPGLWELWVEISKHRNQSPTWFRPWLSEEEGAGALRTWEPLVVPGLLQTEAYARALLRCEPGFDQDRVESLVAARLARQKILGRTGPPMYLVLLDEGALNRPIGGAEVMREQLAHLIEIADAPHITLQITPLGATSGLSGAITLAQSADGQRHTVHLETAAEPLVTTNSALVATATMKFDAIRAESLPHSASVEFIRKRMVEKWTSRPN